MSVHFEFTGRRVSRRLELRLYEKSSQGVQLLGQVLLPKRLAVFLAVMASCQNDYVNFYEKYCRNNSVDEVLSKPNVRGRIQDIRNELAQAVDPESKQMIASGLDGEWTLNCSSRYFHPSFLTALEQDLLPEDFHRLSTNPGSPLDTFE